MDEDRPFNDTEKMPFNEGMPDLYDDLLRLASSRGHQDWLMRLQGLIRRMGFERYLLSLDMAASSEDPFRGITTTFPQDWLDCYKQRGFIRLDPIRHHCKQRLAPMFWGQARCQAQESTLEFWEQRESFGLRLGISIPLRYRTKVGSINVAQPADMAMREPSALQGHLLEAESQPSFGAGWSAALGNLFLLIPFALEGLEKFNAAHRPETTDTLSVRTMSASALSVREKECLKWSGVGKTSWEIGRILGCSERTVNFHLSNATRKLDASNRRQAVGVAVARGLIQL